MGHAAVFASSLNWTDTAHAIPSRTWIRTFSTPVTSWSITSPRRSRNPWASNASFLCSTLASLSSKLTSNNAKEPAELVEHALFDDLAARNSTDCWIVSAECPRSST